MNLSLPCTYSPPTPLTPARIARKPKSSAPARPDRPLRPPPPLPRKITRISGGGGGRIPGGARTDLDGGNAEPARLEDDADAARRDALPEPAHHPAGHQHVLHLAPPGERERERESHARRTFFPLNPSGVERRRAARGGGRRRVLGGGGGGRAAQPPLDKGREEGRRRGGNGGGRGDEGFGSIYSGKISSFFAHHFHFPFISIFIYIILIL